MVNISIIVYLEGIFENSEKQKWNEISNKIRIWWKYSFGTLFYKKWNFEKWVRKSQKYW